MTAVNIVAQPKFGRVHVATDAAIYQKNGVVSGMGTKVMPVPHWPGVVAGRGAMVAVPWIGSELSAAFPSFDALIENVVRDLPAVVERRGLEGCNLEVIVAGISKARGPESYVIHTSDELPRCLSDEDAKASPYFRPAYELIRLPDQIQGPAVTQRDLIVAANFEGIDPDDDPAVVEWGLRKMLEMQRQADFGDGIHWIGGFGQLTIVTADRIEQKILQRWSEDQVGGHLHPTPIDWSDWHAANPKPSPNNVSRLKRDMLERRARKHRPAGASITSLGGRR